MTANGVNLLMTGTMILLSTVGMRRMADPGPHDASTWFYAHRRGLSRGFVLLGLAVIALGLLFLFQSE